MKSASQTIWKSAELEASACTDVGRVRRLNEDAFGSCVEAGVFVVCDGMGGAASGDVASRMAVDAVIERLCGSEAKDMKKKVLEGAIAAANRAIHAQAAKDAALEGMGTTLVMAAVRGQRARIAHVGDSRCYLFRAGSLTRLTQDHSLVEEQVRMGHMTEEDATWSPLRNVITRAVGTQRSVAPEIAEIALEAGDSLLLCTDGLTREVADEGIAAILGEENDLETACERLIAAANAAGGRDNVTAILIRHTQAS